MIHLRHILLCSLVIVCGAGLPGCGVGSDGYVGGVLAGIEGTGSPRDGIEGTGVVGMNDVSSLSSVYVDGIAFNTNYADIILDGVPAGKDDLRPGMVLYVVGELSDDGLQGIATRVEFDRALFGPIEEVDFDSLQLNILGQLVRLNDDTVFEGIPRDEFQIGQLCMLSGLYDPVGELQASLVSCSDNYESGITELEVEGIVRDLDLGLGYFRIGNLDIQFSETIMDTAAGPLADGAWAEVIGSQLEPLVLRAEQVRIKPVESDPTESD